MPRGQFQVTCPECGNVFLIESPSARAYDLIKQADASGNHMSIHRAARIVGISHVAVARYIKRRQKEKQDE